jgi:AcrR family transcriptional regulator
MVCAVRLHLVAESVKGRAARTELRIVEAATDLFLANGYQGTTLSGVAEAAGVAERTVYVRFGTKAALLKRVVDVAIVGDTLPIDVVHRDWHRVAMTAPTLHERLAAHAAGTRALLERLGPLLVVAAQAEPDEPIIAQAAQAGREATLAETRESWQQLRADGLMNPDSDLAWVIATTSLLGAAETYVLMTRTLRWSPAEYEAWRYRTWLHFATTPGPAGA